MKFADAVKYAIKRAEWEQAKKTTKQMDTLVLTPAQWHAFRSSVDDSYYTQQYDPQNLTVWGYALLVLKEGYAHDMDPVRTLDLREPGDWKRPHVGGWTTIGTTTSTGGSGMVYITANTANWSTLVVGGGGGGGGAVIGNSGGGAGGTFHLAS